MIVVRWLVAVALLAAAFAGGAYYQSTQKNHSAINAALLASQDESAWWAHFIASLDRAGKIVDEATAAGPEIDRLEGYRLITRMAGLGFDRFLEAANPAQPDFFRLQSPTRKFAGDSPEQLYHSANLSADYSYRITGQLFSGDVETLLIEASVYGGDMSFEGGSRRLVSFIDESTLVSDEQGYFEITLSKEPAQGNWLKLEDDVKNVLVRRYFKTPQENDLLPLTIERIDGNVVPAPLQRQHVLKGMLGTAAFVEETVRFWYGWVEQARANYGVNTLMPLVDNGDLLTPSGVRYMEGYWELAPSEALRITFTPPEVPYWTFVPMNIWMESFEWREIPASKNNFMAEQNPDGTVTLVLSAQDPEVPNWISTQGHTRGLMALRFARMGEQALPVVKTDVYTLP